MSADDAHRRDWEAMGALDPLWAILSHDEGRHGGWDDDAFFATGRRDADRILATLEQLGLPERRDTVLELGCGVGRLIRPLAGEFGHCIGIDISEPMIRQAAERNADLGNCDWRVNRTDDLRDVPDRTVDLVLTTLVLQHLPSKADMLRYLGELGRVLATGGVLIAQAPASMPLRQRLQPRRRAYAGLRRVGVSERVLYERLGLNPIRMNWIPRAAAESRLRGAGLDVLAVAPGWLGDGAAAGREVNVTYVATRRSRTGA